jgi:6-pyruvoyl tetrahydropterin synthase/QueD family protein
MHCLECGAERQQLDNAHLISCSGLTLHEYALRHSLPLDLVVSPDQVNTEDPLASYPRACSCPGEAARSLLRGLRLSGLVQTAAGFAVIPGEVRRLDLLLWELQYLKDYGFRFRQEYRFDRQTNRVVADNRLKARRENLPHMDAASLSLVPPPDFRRSLAVCIAHVGELHAGYLFLQVPGRADAEEIRTWLLRERGIEFITLDTAEPGGGVILRSYSQADSTHLFEYLRPCLEELPGVWERFHDATPQVTVVKELVFDAAHFITDHPAKCSNLHGGRYTLQIKVAGRIDPVTACVIDYGYLKRVVNSRVVERFDHHNLNYVARELAWRSSTEMLCIYIWEQLIGFLPGLVELQLYETQQSWCHYRGPDLAEFQARGSNSLLHHFTTMDAPALKLREQLGDNRAGRLSVVA